jgi:hypothetical protein
MQYSLAHQLGKRSGALDPDAKAYIAAVETAGATVTSGQKKAINTFVKTGKSDGWYSSIKRLYLPIWASAAPNAVDMITRASGTFNGTVTHSAGYVQGDGSTGYFDPGTAANLHTLGLSNESLHFMTGVYTGGTAASIPVGVWDGVAANRCQITNEVSPSSVNRFACPDNLITNTAVLADANRNGILIGSCTAADNRFLIRRKTTGVTTDTNTVSSATNVPNDRPYFMARKNTSSFDVPYNGKVFAYGLGSKLSLTEAENYSLALKNLWETSTSLTLP